jgi:hypothetical protein
MVSKDVKNSGEGFGARTSKGVGDTVMLFWRRKDPQAAAKVVGARVRWKATGQGIPIRASAPYSCRKASALGTCHDFKLREASEALKNGVFFSY